MDSNVCQVIDTVTGISGSCEYNGKILEMSSENGSPASSSSIEATMETVDPSTALQNNYEAIENITQCNNQNAVQIIKDSNIINESSISTNSNNNKIININGTNNINNNNFNSNAINPPINTVNRTATNLSMIQAHNNTKQQERNGIMEATSLNEQHKFVKFSLPSNSMNLIQSSTPFINKSKHLFNLITEKSTNIMERTLLPQYLVVRNDLNDKKRLEYSAVVANNAISNGDNKAQQTINTTFSGAILEQKIINDVDKQLLNNAEVGSDKIDELHDANDQVRVSNCGESVGDAGERLENNEKNFSEARKNCADENRAASQEGKYEVSIHDGQKGELVDRNKNWESFVGCENEAAFIEDKNKTLIAEAKNAAAVDETDFISTQTIVEPKIDPTQPLICHDLVAECRRLKEEKMVLETRLKALEEKNIIQTVNSSEVIANTIDDRDKTIERLTNELRAALFHQDEMQKELAVATKEKESMVMKYAVSEKQLIDSQKAKSVAEKRMKELQRDYELMEGKWKHGQSERMKISSILDSKCRELVEVQKEVDKLREEHDVRDVKLKWTQTKLKSEMEMHKETHDKLEKALGQVNQMKEEFGKIRRESHETIKKFQQSEENKAVSLDQQLKEQQAKLILERHVTEDKEMLRLQLVREVEMLNNRQHILMEENNALSLKIEELENNKVNYEKNLGDLKAVADRRQKEILELTDKLCNLETLKLDLINKQQMLAAMQAELERIRLVNKELQVDMDCCLQRETSMLEFTQKLTDKNVKLQSEFSAIEAKASKLETEQGPLHETIAQLKAKVKTLQDNLTSEKNKRIEECEILAKHVAEQTQLAQNLTQMLEDSRGENSVLKRKHQVSLKELTRELQQLRKKLEVYEAKGVSQGNSSISRAASNTSLNTADGVSQNGSSAVDSLPNSNEILSYNNLDKAALIDRIIKMQRINVKRAEKLDFLEEHTRALVAELQKKTKIIQNYILTENFDAMGSNERDKYKAELIKHGGIMASVYHQRVSDDNMTLELSLEINQKLQTVLEDALLKNITLKDNIDTLGEEIARLTIQNQQRTSK